MKDRCCLYFFSILHGVFTIPCDLREKLFFIPEFALSAGEVIEADDDIFAVYIVIKIKDVSLYRLYRTVAVDGRIDPQI